MSKVILASGKDVNLKVIEELMDGAVKAYILSMRLRNEAFKQLQVLHTLEKAGVDFARPLYQGKYLYRHVPAEGKGMKRRRLYVGAGAEKTGPALAAMHRGMRYHRQTAKLLDLLRLAALARGPSTQIVRILQRLDHL